MRPGQHRPAWSLILFTVLTQAAVGLHLLRAWYGEAIFACGPPTEVETLVHAIRPTVLILLAMGLAAAMLHLGRLGASRLALSNLRTSWLSRELVLVTLFDGAVGVHYCAERMSVGPDGPREALEWMTALLGVCLILAMARIYMLRTVPAWNTLFTPISFLMTTLLLGAAALTALLAEAGIDVHHRLPGLPALLLLAEFFGRYVFYAMHRRVGL